jgi:L-lysine 6-transaminase
MLDDKVKAELLEAAIGKPSNSDFYTTQMAKFVRIFSEQAAPPQLPNMFFVSGGSLAVENALKAAFDWKVRKNLTRNIAPEKGTKVLHFREAFHGRSGYTLSLTNTDEVKIKYFPKFDWPRIINPKIVFPITAPSHERTVAAERQAIAEIKSAIRDNPDDIAALIIEPIQGEGGDNHFRKEFLVELRTLADENDFMLIFDEVQTGIGLTGRMWCFQAFDVVPDMLVFGKKMQVCGFLCSDRINEVEDNVFSESSRLNSTWGGNLVDMVRAKHYLRIIAEEGLVAQVKERGEYFLGRLLELEYEFSTTMRGSRGRGFMLAFDLPDREARTKLLQVLYENNVIALGCGPRSVRFRPALTFSMEDIDQALSMLRTSLEQI